MRNAEPSARGGCFVSGTRRDGFLSGRAPLRGSGFESESRGTGAGARGSRVSRWMPTYHRTHRARLVRGVQVQSGAQVASGLVALAIGFRRIARRDGGGGTCSSFRAPEAASDSATGARAEPCWWSSATAPTQSSGACRRGCASTAAASAVPKRARNASADRATTAPLDGSTTTAPSAPAHSRLPQRLAASDLAHGAGVGARGLQADGHDAARDASSTSGVRTIVLTSVGLNVMGQSARASSNCARLPGARARTAATRGLRVRPTMLLSSSRSLCVSSFQEDAGARTTSSAPARARAARASSSREPRRPHRPRRRARSRRPGTASGCA